MRGLGVWDGVLLTVGSVIGTGIFLVSSDIAKVLPHGGMLLLVWLAGGLLSLTGALTYAELGAMFPRAGGIYHFLKEAYGPLPGFLYGWACFLVMMSGGIAAIAVGFGEYLGAFFPFASTGNVLVSQTIGSWTWKLSGVQVVAVAAILVLTAVNHFGLKQGAAVQNLMTVLKIGAILAVAALGFLVPAKSALGITAPLGAAIARRRAARGVRYRDDRRPVDLRRLVRTHLLRRRDEEPGPLAAARADRRDGDHHRPLPADQLRLPARHAGRADGRTSRVSVRPRPRFCSVRSPDQWLAAAVVVSTFGCLAATILYSSRIYQPMAEDGLFFRSLSRIDPLTHVPARSLWAQSLWAVVLTLSGSYSQLYTYSVLVTVLFHVLAGAAVFVLRRTRPAAPRPYRVWGYPLVPIAFLGGDGGAARQHGGRAPGRVAARTRARGARPAGLRLAAAIQPAARPRLDPAGKRDRDDPSGGAIRGVVRGAVIALVAGVSHQQPELDRIAEAVAPAELEQGVSGARELGRAGLVLFEEGRHPAEGEGAAEGAAQSEPSVGRRDVVDLVDLGVAVGAIRRRRPTPRGRPRGSRPRRTPSAPRLRPPRSCPGRDCGSGSCRRPHSAR